MTGQYSLRADDFVRDGKTSSDAQVLNSCYCIVLPASRRVHCPPETQQVITHRANSKHCSFPGWGFLKLLGVGILVIWGTACSPDTGHH